MGVGTWPHDGGILVVVERVAGARKRGVRGVSVQDYEAFYRRSIEDPEGFWAEQARKIHWNTDWDEVLDYGSPPFARWFVGGGPTSVTTRWTDTCRRARTRTPWSIFPPRRASAPRTP